MSKYKNVKTIVYKILFDSKLESDRYLILRDKEKKGFISNLQLQPVFVLLDAFKDDEGIKHQKIEYIADFKYMDAKGQWCVEDVKSSFTAKDKVYALKKKLLLSKYHGFKFREVIPK